MGIIRHAPAKINLFLHVTGKRADGYHILESLVVFTKYGDEIQVTEDSVLSLEIIGEFASALSAFPKVNNLVWKTAIALQNCLPKPRGAKITLTKNIPVASGIGGGSADAAATIHALCELWKLNIPDKKLSEIALGLGSDVPICLYGKPAIMRGVGDDIMAVTLQDKPYIVLINPNIPLATAEVFKNFSMAYHPPLALDKNLSVAKMTSEMGYTNDLEMAAIKKLPIISEMLNSLENTQGCFLSRMSGSGATCFGLYHDKISADNAVQKLQEKYKQAWCISTSIA